MLDHSIHWSYITSQSQDFFQCITQEQWASIACIDVILSCLYFIWPTVAKLLALLLHGKTARWLWVWFQAWGLSVWSLHVLPACALVGSFQALRLPPTAQRHAREVNCNSKIVCVRVNGQCWSKVSPCLNLSQLGEAAVDPCNPELRNKQVWKYAF